MYCCWVLQVSSLNANSETPGRLIHRRTSAGVMSQPADAARVLSLGKQSPMQHTAKQVVGKQRPCKAMVTAAWLTEETA